MKIDILLTCLAFFSFASCGEKAAGSVRKTAEVLPNIVFIISDDQAWTDYGFLGHDHIETPNLNKLA